MDNNASQASLNRSVRTSSTGNSKKSLSASVLASKPDGHSQWRVRAGLKIVDLPSAVFQTFQAAQVKPPRNLPGCLRAEISGWHLKDVSIDEEVKALVESDVHKTRFVDNDTFGIENRWSYLRATIRGFRRASRNPDANEATGRRVGDIFIGIVFDISNYPTDIIPVQGDDPDGDVVCFEVPVQLHYSAEYAQTATLDTYVLLPAHDSKDIAQDLHFGCYRLRPQDKELKNEAYLTAQVNPMKGVVAQLFTAEAKRPTMVEETPVNQLSYGLDSGQLRRRALGLKEATLFGAVYAGSRFKIYAAWWGADENPLVYMSLQMSYNLGDIEEFLNCYIVLCQIRDYSIKVFQEDLVYLRDEKNLASIVKSMEAHRWRTPSVSLDDTPGEFRSTESLGLNSIKEEDMDTVPEPSGSGTETPTGGEPQDPPGSSAGGLDLGHPMELCAGVTVSGSTSSNNTDVTASDFWSPNEMTLPSEDQDDLPSETVVIDSPGHHPASRPQKTASIGGDRPSGSRSLKKQQPSGGLSRGFLHSFSKLFK